MRCGKVKGQESLESIILDGAKRILRCSTTCNEAIRGDMGVDTLQL